MKKPFEYLSGMVPDPEAPLVDNPGGFYCPECREQDKLNCDDPGLCGNLRPMKPLPVTTEEDYPTTPGIKQAVKKLKLPPLKLDDSRGQVPLQEQTFVNEAARRTFARSSAEDVFPERLMGRRTTITELPDGEQQDWDWFMENLDPEKWA